MRLIVAIAGASMVGCIDCRRPARLQDMIREGTCPNTGGVKDMTYEAEERAGAQAAGSTGERRPRPGYEDHRGARGAFWAAQFTASTRAAEWTAQFDSPRALA